MTKVLSIFRRPKPTRRLRRGVYLLPSVITVANMFCGWASIVYAMRGDYVTAAPLIAFAMILDKLDGWAARHMGASSDFGVEFDSLADIISFGVAPAVLVFSWGLEPFGRVGWAIGFLYITAAAMRLARFNSQKTGDNKRYFLGLPSPAAAGVLAATVFAYPMALTQTHEAFLALAVVIVPAALMVSRVRYRSFGALALSQRRSYLTLFQIAVVIVAIVVLPQVVLAVMAYSYLLSGLVGLASSKASRQRNLGVSRETKDRKRPAS